MTERIAALSLVVPAFDEETRLPRTLATASAALPGLALESEIVVVDDGSRDRTAEIAGAFVSAVPIRVVRMPWNSGKGAAVAAGVEAARHPLVAFTDADCPYDLESLRPMLAALAVGRVDVAIGARELPDSQVSRGYGALRFASGKVFSWLTWLVIGLPFRDSQCGLKAFRRDVARALFAVRSVDRFGFDFELLAAAVDNRFAVERFPVRLTHDDDSRIDLWRDSREMLRDLLRVRRNLRRGVYRFVDADARAPGDADRAPARCPVCGASEFSPRLARDGHRLVECAVCDLWYLNPPPSSAALESFYGEDYFASERSCAGGYADYAAQADDLRATFRQRLALVEGVRENARLLDVGGGYGYLADAAAADARFAECWVVEASREAASRVSPEHRTVVGWFPDVELPERSFDLVSLQDCLEHLLEPRRALERARELLRPDGRLLVTTPNTASLVARVQGRSWISIKLPEHVALYSPPNLSRLLIDAGFAIDRVARAYQRVRLDFLASRLLAPWPRAAGRLAAWLRESGLGARSLWVPSGSITVVATRRERTQTRSVSGGAGSAARSPERDDATPGVTALPTRA